MEADKKQQTGYPSIDKPWNKFFTEAELNAPLPKMTLYQILWRNNGEHPNDTAILYYGRKISYGELFREIDLCAMALKNAGIQKGDCVTLCTSSTPESIIVALSCNKIGVLANFINPLFTTEQMADRINETGSVLLFVLDRVYERVEDALDKTCIQKVVVMPIYESMPRHLKLLVSMQKRDSKLSSAMKQDGKYLTWQKFLRHGEGKTDSEYRKLEEPYQPNTPAVMVYSSGSTGASKGIVLSNDGINATLSNYNDTDFPYNRGDTFLQMVPIFASTGFVLSIMMPLLLGITVIPEPVFSKETFVKDMARYRPSMTLGSTTMWRYAAQCSELKKTDLSGMTYPIIGGESIRPQDKKEIIDFLRTHGCTAPLAIGYGMCELGSTVTASTSRYFGKDGGAGLPLLHARAAAFDVDTDQELKYYQRGEIRVDSPARMYGYYKNPKATDEYFFTDESGIKWGKTGDIGYIDEDGEVFILGRASDSFVSAGGDIVYNFDAEAVILQDDRVTACKVLGIPTEAGMLPVAHIQLRKDCSDSFVSIISKIDEQCRDKLPPYSVPVAYKQREFFPVHPNAKLDLQSLREERNGFVDASGKQYSF